MNKKTKIILSLLVAIALLLIILPLIFADEDKSSPQQQALLQKQVEDEKVSIHQQPELQSSNLQSGNVANGASDRHELDAASSNSLYTNLESVAAPVAQPADSGQVNVSGTEQHSSSATLPLQAEEVEPKLSSSEASNMSIPFSAGPRETGAESTVSENLQAQKWVVQVGSFKVKQNAEHLKETLLGKGYSAYTDQLKSQDQTCVLIGPVFSHDEAAKIAAKLYQEENLDSLLIKLPTEQIQ